MKTWNCNRTDTMPTIYTIIMIRSAGAKFPPEHSDRNLIVKTVCETDVAQWQLQSFSGCICQWQDTTRTANLVITATASTAQHGNGCISVCRASCIRVTVIVIDPHSTKVDSLSLISPWHLAVSECLSWTAVVTVSLEFWVLELSNCSAWNKP